ncbi:TBC1 domain family member 22A-like [Mirounga angustirostris]|uniref:TBC1 domain family member 22A-like n=1 Tax=Mirounga angustirostris TaxID=9716 RepID=UPI00313BDC67
METAHRVLRNHSQRQERRKPQEAPGPEQEPQPSAEPPSVPSGDLRLVKSVSESHTSCPADSAGDTAPLQWSQSLPHSVAAAVGGTSDPSALSSSALSEREASRLDKFKQLLAGLNTDLGWQDGVSGGASRILCPEGQCDSGYRTFYHEDWDHGSHPSPWSLALFHSLLSPPPL